MTSVMKRALPIVLGAVIFGAGIAAGTLHARSAAVLNRFGQPKTVLHVVVYKFKDNVSKRRLAASRIWLEKFQASRTCG